MENTYIGILVFDTVLTWCLAVMTFMMLIGVWDDVKDISARFRLLIEIFLVLAFIFITDTYIDDFHGLWGINALPPEFGIPFSVLADAQMPGSVLSCSAVHPRVRHTESYVAENDERQVAF